MDRFFGLDKPALNERGLSLLCTLYDDVSLCMTEEVLREADIPYLKKDRGGGSAIRLIMGSNPHGTDIYVPEDLLDTAKALFEVPEAEEQNEEYAE
ncbi:MAG: DUF2007 domain-containing protein [Clostridia bacterium]|nr:DUF2007 domain-containing protein [Clostridia bacterium]